MTTNRVCVIVLDSVGVGAMPDAERFGDQGSDTLGHVAESRPLRIPNLTRLGLANIRPLESISPPPEPTGSFGRCLLASNGKDTTSGHWEMMGLILNEPFPTYPSGFPTEVIDAFVRATGVGVLGNCVASGTEIIERLGGHHLKSGKPIVYTSADSVFQIAAHEQVIPVDRLYQICATARDLLGPPHQVGRVIARPFEGSEGAFRRTPRRKDFAIPPFINTVLDNLTGAGVAITTIGKIASIYCYRGTGTEIKTRSNGETAAQTLGALESQESGLIFANFVDFDMHYGHRNDVEGYARALEEFDLELERISRALRPRDLLILTSDHGCDPSTPSTDHSREYTLLLAHCPGAVSVDLGTRGSLADIGATVAQVFGVESPAGTSFLDSATEFRPIPRPQ